MCLPSSAYVNEFDNPAKRKTLIFCGAKFQGQSQSVRCLIKALTHSNSVPAHLDYRKYFIRVTFGSCVSGSLSRPGTVFNHGVNARTHTCTHRHTCTNISQQHTPLTEMDQSFHWGRALSASTCLDASALLHYTHITLPSHSTLLNFTTNTQLIQSSGLHCFPLI